MSAQDVAWEPPPVLAFAAERIRLDYTEPTEDPDRFMHAVADLLDAASAAFPLNPAHPPRNPVDRVMVYKAITVARAYTDGVEGEWTP